MAMREFTTDVGARFRKGDVRDYPPHTWTGIAESAGLDINEFSKPVGDGTPIPKRSPVSRKGKGRRRG